MTGRKLLATAVLTSVLVVGMSTPALAASGPTKPATTKHAAHAASSKQVMNLSQIWAVVRPAHGIRCSHATKELRRIQAAVAALSKRISRLSTGQLTYAEKLAQKRAMRHHRAHVPTFAHSKRIALMRRLEAKALRLEQKIETRCHVSAPVT